MTARKANLALALHALASKNSLRAVALHALYRHFLNLEEFLVMNGEKTLTRSLVKE